MLEAPAELVAAAAGGDAEALGRLVRLYERPVLRVAWQVLGHRHDAEDAAQEAWCVAVRRLDTLREPARFNAWLYRIVANVALRRRQQRAYVGKRLSMDAAGVASAQMAELGEGAETGLANMLPTALEALSGKDRLVMSLHYHAGMPLERIAWILDVPVGTVKSRLHHMRQTIRKEINAMAATPRPQEHVPADFRQVVQGMRGDIAWQPALTPDLKGWSILRPGPTFEPVSDATLPKAWQFAGDGLVGEDPPDGNGTCLMFGDTSWTDMEVSMLLTVLRGGNGQIFFRMDTTCRRWYVLDLMMGWQAVAVNLLEVPDCTRPHLTRLSVVNYPLEHQREYAVNIAARGQSLTTYVDGALVNQVTHPGIACGGTGLNVWQGKSLFRDIRVRQMS